MRSFQTGAVCAVLCAAFPLWGPACSGDRDRVLLIGIDGATLRIARPLMQAGRLPHLAQIASEGAYGPLRSQFPLSSPRIWTTIATGKVPEKHGILGFALPDETGEQRLYLSSDRTTHALWNMVSDAGLSVVVVNWWNTYPLEPIRGFVASDHLLPLDLRGRRRMSGVAESALGPIVHPLDWGERTAALLEDKSPLTAIPDPFADTDAFARWVKPERLTTRYENDAALVRIALAAERAFDPDLLMLFLPGIDRVSHVIWAGVEPAELYPKGPRMTRAQRDATGGALRGYYEYTDALIGMMLERYLADDLVLVVSDHGFEAGRGLGVLTGNHETEKALHGVIYARGRGIDPPSTPTPVTVADVTPTILAWLGLPVGEDMDGRPAGFLKREAAPRIATWDTTEIRRFEAVPSGSEEQMLEQLQSLGYLEDAPSP